MKRAWWYVAAVLRRLLLACCVCGAWASGVAHAYEDQATWGGEIGYMAGADASVLPAHGASVGMTGSLGLSDTFSARARLAYVFYPADSRAHLGIAGAEIVYLLDVLQVVPFFGVGADAMLVVDRDQVGLDPVVHGVLGVDYLVDWDWTLGLDVRPMVRLAEASEARVHVAANLRISFVFDL